MQGQLEQAEGHGCIATRLAASRCFIGRQAPLDTLREALDADDWPYHLIHIHGRPGVGKTHLLQRMAALVKAAGHDARWMTYDELQQNGHEIVTCERAVVFIDDAQIRTEEPDNLTRTFGRIGTRCLLVIAGRCAPPVRWRADGAWSWFARAHELGHFDEAETAAYLAARGVDSRQTLRLYGLTQGHPLSLALACAQLLDSRGERSVESALVGALVELVTDDRRDAHAILDAASVVRCTREDVLAELLATANAGSAFRLLSKLPFVVANCDGLSPLPILRAALVRDLQWRNPARYEELRERARGFYLSRLRAGAADRGVLLRDLMYLFVDDDLASTRALVEDDSWQSDLVRYLVQRGQRSVEEIEGWLGDCPDAFRGHFSEGRLSGVRRTCRLAPDVAEHASLFDHLAREAQLAHGERAVVVTAWLEPEARAVRSLLLDVVADALGDDTLAVTFIATREPRCMGSLERCGAQRVASAEDGPLQIYACDWRRTPAEQWLTRVASEEARQEATLTPYAILTRHSFEEAVRHALRSYHRPGELRRNQLLSARVVAAELDGASDTGHRVASLRRLLREAADVLAGSPKHHSLHRVVKRTYLEGAPSQEQAAESLGLPLSTYRRHLKRAVAEIVDSLWRAELGGT